METVKKLSFTLSAAGLFLLWFLTATPPVQAVIGPPPTSGCTMSGDVPTLACIGEQIANIVKYLFMFAGVTAFAFLFIGAVKFITSGGDPKAVAGAKNTMTYALIGLVFVLIIFTLLNFIETFLGLPKGTLSTFSFGQ